MKFGYEAYKEFPSRKEQLDRLKDDLENLKKKLEKFNLPENLPDVLTEDANLLPDHLSEEDKKLIIRIKREMETIKIRIADLDK